MKLFIVTRPIIILLFQKFLCHVTSPKYPYFSYQQFQTISYQIFKIFKKSINLLIIKKMISLFNNVKNLIILKNRKRKRYFKIIADNPILNKHFIFYILFFHKT